MISNLAFSQETNNKEIRNYLDRMFEKTQLTRVPTGFLLDYAVDLVNFDNYNGRVITDSNSVSISTFENALVSLQSADVTKRQLTDVQRELYYFRNEDKSNNINLGVLFYRYNYISEDALSANKIQFIDGQVIDNFDNHGNWINPYEESEIFCFSPNVNECDAGSVTFRLNSENLFTNANIEQVEFDAGLGNGFAPLQNSAVFYYPEARRYEIKLRIKVNGMWFHSHSYIDVLSNATVHQSATPPNDSYVISTTFNGKKLSALVSNYYRGTSLRNPFIVVEGFDPWKLTNAMYGESADSHAQVQLGTTNHIDFLDDYWESSTLSRLYDLVYIDWNDSIEDIKGNAQLFQLIIQEINNKRDSDDTSGIVLMGQSMGGLVARYALTSMENQEKTHNVTTFISHDTPHLGANVPLGGLYFTRSLISFVNKYDTTTGIVDLFVNKRISKTKKEIINTLDAMSVKQMLLTNVVNNNGSFVVDNTMHDKWQQELKDIGFPKGDKGKSINNIAIVNGRNPLSESYLTDNGYFLYLDGYIRTRYWLNAFLLPSHKLSVNAIVKPYTAENAGQVISNLEIKLRKKFLWTITKTNKLFSGASYTGPSSGPYTDGYPGSTYSLDSNSKSHYGDNFLGKMDYDFSIGDKIMFIPTASALAMNENIFRNEPYRDYYNNPPIAGRETPFAAYYISDDSKEHITLDFDIEMWLSQQLQFKINGPDKVDADGDYSVSGVSSGVRWETSDSQIATIDDNGHLTATGNGYVTITAWKYQNGKRWSTSKKVLVSFPDMVLTSKYILNEGYRITANVLGEDNSTFAQVLEKNDLEYEWTILYENFNSETTYSSQNTCSFIPTPDQNVTVCVRLVNKYEHRKCGKTYSLKFKPRTFFELNYDRIIINGLAEIYFIKGNSFDVGTPEDLMVLFGGLTPTDDVPTMTKIMQMVNGEHCYLSYYNKWDGLHDYTDDPKIVDMRGRYYKPDNEFARWSFDYFGSNDFVLILDQALKQAGHDVILSPIKFILKDKDKNSIHNLVLPIVCVQNYQN